MTLASSIIKRAYRKTNIIPLAGTPNSNQSTEALEMLNSLILSSIGNEVGDEFENINFGGNFSEHNQSEYCDDWVPPNTRLVLNLSAADTVELDPYPYEGQRFAVIDAGNTLDTYNLTVSSNGRKIEGSTSNLVLSTEGLERQWMYRADTSDWVKITSLATSDNMPFPIEFDMYFVISLAIQINPQYGQKLTAEDSTILQRSRSQIRSRYRNRKGDMLPDFGVVDPKDLYTYTDYFNFGHYPYWLRRF